nr:hypothetical protein [Kineosporia sp. NBRC 101677]
MAQDPGELGPGPAEHRLRSAVAVHHPAGGVHQDHRVRERVEDLAAQIRGQLTARPT